MRKNFGAKPWVYPQPVLMIGTYDENGTPNLMNAAWGGQYGGNTIMICLGAHKTTENIKAKGVFTVSFATAKTAAPCDYVGTVSANSDPDKSENIDAPVIKELPLTLECKLVKFNEDGVVIGEIVNVSADESILTDGKVDYKKLDAIVYEPINLAYLRLGEKVGDAFKIGDSLK